MGSRSRRDCLRNRSRVMMDYVNAFWVGGLICALVQILMEKTKLMPGRIMVLLVVTGAVIGFLGWYEPFQEFAGAGASVPLLGFGNVLIEGREGGRGRAGAFGPVRRRLQGRGGGNLRRADIRLSGQPGLQVEDEALTGFFVSQAPRRRCPCRPGICQAPCPRWRPASWRGGRCAVRCPW